MLLKSAKTMKNPIKTTEENRIRNFLSKGDLIKNYILIRLMFNVSSFIFPRPILCAIEIYSILSVGTPSIFAAAASAATQSEAIIWDFI